MSLSNPPNKAADIVSGHNFNISWSRLSVREYEENKAEAEQSVGLGKTIQIAEKFVPPKLQPLWNHEAGPKTIFFWAPLFKWGLVVASISDLDRPADKLSVPQSGALAATGFIWARWSLVIIPKNWSLCSVNFFVGLTNLYQVVRAIRHQQSMANETT